MTKDKSKHSAKTDLEESNTLHTTCKRQQKFTRVKSDCQASQLEDSASVKVKHAKADQQSEGMVYLEVEVNSGRKEKKHKKTAVDDTVDGCVKTVSSKSHKRHAKTLKDKDRVDESDEPGITKVAVGDNTDENVESASISFSSVKRKSGKKRKALQDESLQDEHATQSADTVVPGYSVKKKKKKHRQDAGKDKTRNLSTEPTSSAAASSSQYRALEYLRTWKLSHDSWTFQKVRQVWLLQHMYDPAKVTVCLTVSTWNL